MCIRDRGIYSNVYVQTSSMSVGFNGMAVALLAMNSPIGIPFAAFLFGALQIGGVGTVSYTHLDVYKRQLSS